MATKVDIYYIDTVEQVTAAEDYPYTVNEYGARTKYVEKFEQVESRYFKKLSDVSNDLVTIGEDKHHYYMNIKITNTEGGILKEETLGTKQDVYKKDEPQPEPENNVEG